jgi:homoserine O-succinyltransferase/O-acetyltransferase
MPVLIDRGSRGYSVFGAADPVAVRPRSDSGDAGSRGLDIVLVNNMPDHALDATERQFLRLLDAAAEDRIVRVALYTRPDVPEAEWKSRHPIARDSAFGDVWSRRPDGLIVTGTEPRASELRDEPCWPTLARLVDWAEQNAVPAIWSCLAAHAAVHRLDGIRRRTLDDKCFGVFDCHRVAEHALTRGVDWPMRVPHSRWNDVPEQALVASGYEVLTRSPEAGVDAFVRTGQSLFVFFQGHPEYQPLTPLREYRRDVARFLKSERATYPALPTAYFDNETTQGLLAFGERAVADRRAALIVEFPLVPAASRWTDMWQTAATRIYRNWLSALAERKAALSGSAGSIAPSMLGRGGYRHAAANGVEGA